MTPWLTRARTASLVSSTFVRPRARARTASVVSSAFERPRARARFAFTLLEVMAAVAIFGLIYTVLARVGLQGLRAEGEADRRLRASLIADNRFGEIEARLLAGGDLPIAESDDELDEFTIHTAVSELEVEIPPPPEVATKRQRDVVGNPVSKETEDAAVTTGSFFDPAGPGKPSPMRRLEVFVRWTEGVSEREVRRTGFGFDRTAAEPLLSALAEADEPPGDESSPEGDTAAAADQKSGAPESATAGAAAKKKPRQSKSSAKSSAQTSQKSSKQSPSRSTERTSKSSRSSTRGSTK